jgi:hypothetical protein
LRHVVAVDDGNQRGLVTPPVLLGRRDSHEACVPASDPRETQFAHLPCGGLANAKLEGGGN